MVTDWLRGRTQGLLVPIAHVISLTGLTPTAVTVLGFIFNVGVAGVLAAGHLVIGGVLVILSSLFDALDGALARYTNQVTRFGGFLDSTLDRVSEAVLFLGLLFYYIGQNSTPEILLIFVSMVGSQMVSYTRARAEGLGLSCKVGWFTRFERIAVLVLGLLLQQMLTALVILSIGSAWTTVQRIFHVRAQLRGE